eukprot:CAMPEP_0172772202 /NCGR_PEP_ID=MMETSP1074-20121228/191952_1 /TAXON_ID=2916 /ORGANISM="Ceratium fusus, Strain PA161109" /LENGTH=44 /DNA_ID= /DNA_START= /DNA_END= /DNA_ORIENTATION=
MVQHRKGKRLNCRHIQVPRKPTWLFCLCQPMAPAGNTHSSNNEL